MRSYVDACGLLVRQLIRQVYGYSTGAVRPAGQLAPTGVDGAEFATVKILSKAATDFAFARTYADYSYPAWSSTAAYAIGDKVTSGASAYACTTAVTGGAGPATDTTHWAVTAQSTKVTESIETIDSFTASIQFFRHALPANNTAGRAVFGMGAFDKAVRLEALLALSSNLELMDSLGLCLESVGNPTNVGALVDGATWEDRGAVDVTFTVSNAETALVETIASAEIDLWLQQQTGTDHRTIEVPQ